jgi:FtsH-binding integral membrane protein
MSTDWVVDAFVDQATNISGFISKFLGSFKHMNQESSGLAYQRFGAQVAADATQSERVAFIQRTYLHLLGAILAFCLIELVIFSSFTPAQIGTAMRPLFASGWSWLVVMGAFMAVSWVAQSWAQSGTSRGMQYAGLGLYIVAESIIFVPILWIAGNYFEGAIQSAGVVTAVVFVGLTAVVLMTKADFSFLRMALTVGGLAAMAGIVVSIVMGISLGIWFSVAMVALIAGTILYQTSNIVHHYRTDQHVAAALGLFASVATMFWYILQIFMRSDE